MYCKYDIFYIDYHLKVWVVSYVKRFLEKSVMLTKAEYIWSKIFWNIITI